MGRRRSRAAVEQPVAGVVSVSVHRARLVPPDLDLEPVAVLVVVAAVELAVLVAVAGAGVVRGPCLCLVLGVRPCRRANGTVVVPQLVQRAAFPT